MGDVKNNNEFVTLNGKQTTLKDFEETKNNLQKNEKLVEVSPGNFKILKRLQG